MNDIQGEIVQWLHTQPDWLQEAADRLLKKKSLSESDVEEIAECLKTAKGQQTTTHRAFTIPGPQSSSNVLRINSIGNIQGVENLDPRRPLTFGDGNLTVIYGHNGSGKSGYTRILKCASGKPRAGDLYPNVFKTLPSSRTCTFEYDVDGTRESFEWEVNAGFIENLKSVDIFDGQEALFYLGGETEASYVPESIALFDKLASVCGDIRQRLDDEQSRLVSALPRLPDKFSDTQAAKIYNALRPNHKKDGLSDILNWTQEDKDQLDQLNERLKNNDPEKLAKQKAAKKKQIDQLVADMKKAGALLCQTECDQIQALKKTADNKRQIAVESAKTQVASAKIEGIGTDTWKALWEAAREYSTKEAYPDHGYPYVEDGARCVLCHQRLDSTAQLRLKDFETYIQGKLETEAKASETAWKEAITALPPIQLEDALQTACQAAGLPEDTWLSEIKLFWGSAQKVEGELKTGQVDKKITGLSPFEKLIELEEISATLEEEIMQHQDDKEKFDRAKAEKDRLDLEARRWTSQQAEAIENEIQRLKDWQQYNTWKQKTSPRNISLKAGETSEAVITQAYIDRFNNELRQLGASRIQVELVKTRIERGRAMHQVRLREAKPHAPNIEAVLSDGERRVVSLAAFLADVCGRPEAAPFIFDDPISSLDHDFEYDVAMRLAKLAKDRQVLVFTHRLTLYGALEDAAKKNGEDWKKQHLSQCCIESFAGTAGHPADEKVWAVKTKKANNILINRLNEAKKYWETGDSANYEIYAQSICTDLRKLLERSVEEDLLNAVVKRHRRSVTTNNMIGALQKITRADCEFIDELMTKYSCYEHSQSQEAPVFIPDEPELRKDLEKLKTWREEFKNRAFAM